MTEAESQRTGQAFPSGLRTLTVDEFFAAYGDQSIELVDGVIVPMSPNQRDSIRPTMTLYNSLMEFVAQHDLGEVWFEVAYVLDEDPRTNWVRGVRQPDISFVAKQRVLEHDQKFGKNGPWRLAPDLAVEIFSPTDSYTDVLAKVDDYLHYGVRLIWIVDPISSKVRIHTPENPVGVQLTEADTLSGDPVVAGWSMPLLDLFGAKQ